MNVVKADDSSRTSHAGVRELTLAMSTALCYGIALGLFPALLSLNVESSGFDTSWNGLLGAIPAFAGMAIGPFVPRIVGRIGAQQAYFAGPRYRSRLPRCFRFSRASLLGSCFASLWVPVS